MNEQSRIEEQIQSSLDGKSYQIPDNPLASRLEKILQELINRGGGGGTSSSITVDSELSKLSTNPVQNKVITEVLEGIQKNEVSEPDKNEDANKTWSTDISGKPGWRFPYTVGIELNNFFPDSFKNGTLSIYSVRNDQIDLNLDEITSNSVDGLLFHAVLPIGFEIQLWKSVSYDAGLWYRRKTVPKFIDQPFDSWIKILDSRDLDDIDLSDYAPIDSPELTGVPKAPTPDDDSNSTQIATTAFVKSVVNELINGAPETLDTLKELADAIEDNKDVVDALNDAINKKVDKEDGKGLSSNDFTDNYKSGLDDGYLPLSGGTIADGDLFMSGGKIFTTTGIISSQYDAVTNHAIIIGVPGNDVCSFHEYGGTWNFLCRDVIKNTIRDGAFWAVGKNNDPSDSLIGRILQDKITFQGVFYGDGNIYMRHNAYEGWLSDLIMPGLVPGTERKTGIKFHNERFDGYYHRYFDFNTLTSDANNDEMCAAIDYYDEDEGYSYETHLYGYRMSIKNVEENSSLSFSNSSIIKASNYNTDNISIIISCANTTSIFNMFFNKDSKNASFYVSNTVYVSTKDLGTSNSKWTNIYATNGTIQTSDRNEKNSFLEISTEKAESLIYGLKPTTYMMNSGTSGRIHWGLISQDIEELLEELGWSSLDFAGFIKTPKMTDGEIDEKTGKYIKEPEVIEGEYDYSLRYDEFIAPMVKIEQNHNERLISLENRVKEQDIEINILKQEINNLKNQVKELLELFE